MDWNSACQWNLGAQRSSIPSQQSFWTNSTPLRWYFLALSPTSQSSISSFFSSLFSVIQSPSRLHHQSRRTPGIFGLLEHSSHLWPLGLTLKEITILPSHYPVCFFFFSVLRKGSNPDFLICWLFSARFSAGERTLQSNIRKQALTRPGEGITALQEFSPAQTHRWNRFLQDPTPPGERGTIKVPHPIPEDEKIYLKR